MRRTLTALGTALALATAAPVHAEIISQTYSFSATNSGTINPFAGSFSITFDNSTDIGGTTTGITAISLPFTLGSALGFSYTPAAIDSVSAALARA